MGDCRRITERMAGYVDDALPPEERLQVEAHLGACRACRDMAADVQTCRDVLRHCGPRLRAQAMPPGLRSRCEALASEQCAARMARWRRTWIPVALATLLIVFTGTAVFSLATHRSNALLAAQLTADHLNCFRDVPTQTAAADPRALEAMLHAKYGWDVHLPRSSGAEGLRLVGAHSCLYIDGRIPHVLYRAHGQNVSLFILEGVSRKDADLVALGHHTRIWTRGANTYVLVSSTDDEALAAVAGYVRQEAQ